MLRIDRHAKTLRQVEQRTITDAGLKERDDLQQMILRSPDAFFGEMGEKLLLVGEEVLPTDFVDDRIDLLAIDQEGAVVVLELKRGSHKLQLLQALAYAGMIARWDRDRLIGERAKLTHRTAEEAADEIEQFLLEDINELNEAQRVILLAENFDYEVLVTAEWLTEKHDLDIRCYRLVLSADGSEQFLNCTCIYPPPEITHVAVQRRHKVPGHREGWADWESAIENFANPAMAKFYRQELASGREGYLRRRVLRFPIAGRPRLIVIGRAKVAYVWQRGRFRGDEEFWRERLGPEADVKAVKDGKALRFFLSTDEHFAQFSGAVGHALLHVELLSGEELPDEEVEPLG